MMASRKISFYQKYGKRILDIILSVIAIILLSPVLLIVALLVRFKLGSPVIFCQPRPGKNEKIFNLYKFRTMTNETDQNGKLLPDSQRLTPFGKFLRKTSLDELPELFCILFGTLSFIGPRPLLVDYLPLYNEHQKLRHTATPGLTGLAQVHGRNSLSWEEKFDLDVDYVNQISFMRDMKILFQTVGVVFSQKGINSATSATMEPFTGTPKENDS